jgi:phosphoribosylaminoimidazole-succinocarboxamide synthase
VRARIALAFFIALAVQPSLAGQPMVPLDSPEAFGTVVQQVGIGLAIGFAARLVVAVRLMGEALGYLDELDDQHSQAEGWLNESLAAAVDDLANVIDLSSRVEAAQGAAAEYAATRGIIIADTKFEFGLDEDGTLCLMDEALTPDSSRFWPAESYQPGRNPPSYDKQFVSDWLKANPDSDYLLPDEVIEKTIEKYEEAFELLTGKKFA